MANLIQGTVDLLIVGGGINGAGIAADAAGRNLSVVLCEQHDLAGATSSASSKLIHGGLRYLEHYEFRLVREALAEREVMLKKAPHIISPLRFCLPHQPHLRPAWMIRAGLFLYDHLGKREALSGSKSVSFSPEQGLKEHITRGFEYSDCWVDDARLVVLNAISARENGASILNRTRCIQAKRVGGLWHVTLEHSLSKQRTLVHARALVNASGPWVGSFIESALKLTPVRKTRLIKGSHIIVPKIYPQNQAYILQNEDQRIVFVIPYQQDFSLIGTTDVEFSGDPGKVAITAEEKSYLIGLVNRYFKSQLAEKDVVASYAGVRPLCDDESNSPSAITRDYTLEVEEHLGSAPLLSVFGGKITTYRKLAETALAKLAPYFEEMAEPWTEKVSLPGADFNRGSKNYAVGFTAAFSQELKQQYPWLPPALINRYCRTYGSLCLQFLRRATGLNQLGQDFGAGLYAAEVDYLITREWAYSCEDILWRRTKLGLYLKPAQVRKLSDYLDTQECRKVSA
ncbi:glycerol-3-phosphate dehydrogenase [Thalassomonas haliotis]|uniref:Glycerol-3-phosphate dehydrogenase n=1 Tax=Thalassomonas haliotis TaxID=485448 RepID=A0ABY7VCI3_9GAMM|nr:glycerol-3-phosphate dehydrogenase [Thalassomonas haliotis]WDE11373.1 glycerol-3-phosphate dehydrogenase [Thalassomonas haliotis]